MKQLKSKLLVVAIALCALLIIGSFGAAAYWSVSQILTGNQMSSGHMAIVVDDVGAGHVATSLSVPNLMPGDNNYANPQVYKITSAAGNPNTNLWFKVDNVASKDANELPGVLDGDIQVSILLATTMGQSLWLVPGAAGPAGATNPYTADEVTAQVVANRYPMSSFNGKLWDNLAGYTDLPAGAIKHISVFYYMPVDASPNSHDQTVTFDMTFGLSQYHP